MHLPGGKTFTVLAPAVSKENCYIQSVKLNGRNYDKSYITHEQIMDGSVFEFEMGGYRFHIFHQRVYRIKAHRTEHIPADICPQSSLPHKPAGVFR